MKKTNPQSGQEIVSQDIADINDYLEDAISVFLGDYMSCSSGVYIGLSGSTSGSNGFTISTGGIFQYNKFGSLEASSGVTVTFPTGGVRTDLVVAYYEEVEDTPVSGYILVDVTTREESIETNPSRRFGACKIQVLTSTTFATCPSTKIPLYELTLSTSAITATSDVRSYSRVQRFVTDIQQDFYNMFYSAF